jgi:long-chain acyl-CoA synthetase
MRWHPTPAEGTRIMVRTVDTLAHILPTAAARHGHKPALICGDCAWSFGELNGLAARLANGLDGLGIRAGDRVTIYALNGWEWVVSYYALARLGAVAIPVNLLLAPDEVRYIVSDCGATAIVAAAHRIEPVLDLLHDSPLETVITIGEPSPVGTHAFEELLRASVVPLERADASPEDLAAIMYTSGTTGRPKGAMLSHRNLWLNAALTATMHARTAQDTTVTAVPLCHVYGAGILNASCISGATLVLLPRFTDLAVLTAIERHRATLLEGVPTMFMHLLNGTEIERFDVSSLTRCTTGGQTVPVSKMEDVERRFDCPLLEVWGMTEVAGIATTHPYYAPNRLGSIGLPVPGVECRIVDPENRTTVVASGDVGELMVRGPIVMRGYYGDAGATRDTIESDGWLHTGDLARLDGDGYGYLVDRKKDVIITSGYKVYPAEVERVLAMHPAVAMVAVTGQPDEARGETGKAYVVLKPDTDVEGRTLQAFCREHLASYKTPTDVHIVPDLPKTSTGKIHRRALREMDAPMSATSGRLQEG